MKSTPKGWPRISSSLYYTNPAEAIDWLCRAFGFELRLKVDDGAGGIAHSELLFGDAVVMVAGSGASKVHPDRYRSCSKAPADVGGANTQNMFAYVDDIEAHCARARAAGARIVSEPSTVDYGEEYWSDRGYECVDIGGHHWWFAQRLRDPK